jgi:uncharacterized protein involved in exopolysaccharide biosynthesis
MSLTTLPPSIPRQGKAVTLGDVSMAGESVPIVSLRDIVRTIFRHAIPIVLIVGVSVTGAFVYLMMTSPTYTAYSKLLVRVGREKLTPLTVSTVPSTNFVFNERVENTNDEIEILRNPQMMALVFPQLKARYQEMVDAARDRPPPVTVMDWIRFVVRETKQGISAGAHRALDLLHEPLYFIGISYRMTEDEMLGALLQNSLGVDFIKETNVIVLSFSWSEPTFAAYALNTFADAFRREQVRLLSGISGAADFYSAQATRTETELKAANREVDDYLASSGLTDPISEKQMAMNLITSLERQQSDARVAEQQTRQKLEAYREKYDQSDEWLETPGVPNVTLPGLADIDARHTEMITRRTAMLSTLRPTAREVRDLDAEIASLRLAKSRSLTNYLNDRLAGEIEEQRVVGERLAEQPARLQRLNALTTHYVALMDRRDQLLAQLKTYRGQIEVLSVNQALNDRGFASIVVLNPGVPPATPSAPRKWLIMGLSLGFGLMFAIAYVILSEFFNHTFAGERDVARVLGLRLMASVPRVGSAEARPSR